MTQQCARVNAGCIIEARRTSGALSSKRSFWLSALKKPAITSGSASGPNEDDSVHTDMQFVCLRRRNPNDAHRGNSSVIYCRVFPYR